MSVFERDRLDALGLSWHAGHLCIRFLWLPKQAPKLSPMDQLWRELKRLIAASRISMLTSDRPLDMPHGLGSSEAYIALPIGPRMLFVADHDGTSAPRLAALDPT